VAGEEHTAFTAMLAQHATARRVLGDCNDVSCGCDGVLLNGDINGDCRFAVSDLDFLKRYYTDQSGSA
jgi:hypothetical protein